MKKKILLHTVIYSFTFSLLFIPFSKAGSNGTGFASMDRVYFAEAAPAEKDSTISEADAKALFISTLYDSLELNKIGLAEEVLTYAYTGYQNLLNKGMIKEPGILSIVDFSKSSTKKRLYIIDMNNYKLLNHTYVAHGKNTGQEFATKFSNKPESLQSSLGFYITRNTYFGKHGLSLKLEGKDKGFNDKAMERAIVLHGSSYSDENFVRARGYLGRSWGCPAVPEKEKTKIINTIKDGTVLFIYHPTKSYLHGSTVLNG